MKYTFIPPPSQHEDGYIHPPTVIYSLRISQALSRTVLLLFKSKIMLSVLDQEVIRVDQETMGLNLHLGRIKLLLPMKFYNYDKLNAIT